MNTIDEPEIEKTDASFMTVGLGVGNTQKWNKNSLSVNANYINLQPYQWLLPDTVEWTKPYQSLGGESVFRQNFEKGLLKIYTSYTVAEFDVKQDNINFPDRLRIQNKNSNWYSNVSYKGSFGNNWKIFTGFSLAKSKNSGFYDSFNFDSFESASHLKLKITKSISKAIKTSFGTDYFYTQFSESLSQLNSGYNCRLFFAAIMLAFTGYFIVLGLEYTHYHFACSRYFKCVIFLDIK